ncbi:rhomboid family intramembrane serine protease [bacterium]|nr:MAG: rhomboid family intramembrane serine protease [bacterium]
MLPLRGDRKSGAFPIATWTVVALNVAIYFWDRGGHLFGPSIHFEDLAMRPREVVAAALSRGDYFPIVSVFTSMFLHGGLMHLLGNLLYLTVFGTAVEEALGTSRYVLYYLAWGFVAAAAQIWVDPRSLVPVLGASGAIGGVLGAYLLLFPSSKIQIVIPPLFFLAFDVYAWILLGLWFFYQVFYPQQGVANWAHIGGFLAGMVTVLIVRREERKGASDEKASLTPAE